MNQIRIKNEILHDKVCPYLGFQGDKEMQLDDLIDWAKRYRCCQRCRRIALVHNGITDIENFEVHYNFFDRHKVSLDVLKDLFVNHQAQITIAGGYIEIHCDKDTWRIPLKLINGQAELLHNNYTRTYAGRRVIDSGYHEQILPKKTVEGALKYILEYDYDLFHGSYF